MDRLSELPPSSALRSLFREPRDLFEQRLAAIRERSARSIAEAGGIYVAGAGPVGRHIAAKARRARLGVFGFLDKDPARHGTVVDDAPVCGYEDVDARRAVVVPASGLHAFTQTRELQARGFAHVVSPSELSFVTGDECEPEAHYLDDLCCNRDRYLDLYFALGDSESRRVLDGVLQHRLSLSIEPLSGVMDTVHAQWFDPAFLRQNDDHVFVDGGAFDGDTATGFINATAGRYRAIHAFEPDPAIAERAQRKLASRSNVVVHAAGLGATSGEGRFATTGLTDGHVGQTGGMRVQIETVDEAVREPVTYLKLDVEGAELDALDGARTHISNERPLIAMAVYHKAQDLWALPERLSAITPGYKYFLRHYTQMAFETVLYATPLTASR